MSNQCQDSCLMVLRNFAQCEEQGFSNQGSFSLKFFFVFILVHDCSAFQESFTSCCRSQILELGFCNSTVQEKQISKQLFCPELSFKNFSKSLEHCRREKPRDILGNCVTNFNAVGNKTLKTFTWLPPGSRICAYEGSFVYGFDVKTVFQATVFF